MGFTSHGGAKPPRTGEGFGLAVCGLLVVLGVLLLALPEGAGSRRRGNPAWVVPLLGSGLVALGLVLVVPVRRSAARMRERWRREMARPDAPWTWDPAWVDPRGLPSTATRNAGALFLVGGFLMLFTSPLFFVVQREVERGRSVALVGLIFPLMGMALLGRAGLEAWRRFKHGDVRFRAAHLPVAPGGELAGWLRVPVVLVPTGEGRLSLQCWCTTLTQDRSNRHRRHRAERVIASSERMIPSRDWVRSGGRSELAIRVPVNGDRVTTMEPPTVAVEAIEWRLRVHVPTSGADFVAEFVVPVFGSGKGGDVAGVGPGLASQDVPAIWEAAGIREEAGGGALLVPPTRGMEGLWSSVVFAGVLAGVGGVLVYGGLWPMGVLVALVALIPLAVGVALWRGGGERVWVEGDAICVRRAGGPVRSLSLGKVGSIESRKVLSVGAWHYFAIEARHEVLPGRWVPERFPVVSLVRGEEAARSLVVWLEERTTRPV